MRTPDEVAAMLRLKALGWGIKRIARELGCSHMTVRRYRGRGRLQRPYRRRARPAPSAGRAGGLAGGAVPAAWRQRRRRAPGALAEKGIAVSLRTVERAVRAVCGGSWRRRRGRRCASRRRRAPAADRLRRAARPDRRRCRPRSSCSSPRSATRGGCTCAPSATSGRRAGSRGWRAPSGTLAASPGGAVRQRRGPGGRTMTPQTREVEFNARLARLCPALGLPAAGLRAVSGAHQGQGRARRRLCEEQRDRRAQLRELGGAGGASRARGCARSPTCASTARPARRRSSASPARRPRPCKPLAGMPPFHGSARADPRKVQADCAIEVDGNAYSVPWRLIGERRAGRRSPAETGAHLPCRPRGRGRMPRRAGRRQRAGRSGCTSRASLGFGGRSSRVAPSAAAGIRRPRCCGRWPSTRRWSGGGL